MTHRSPVPPSPAAVGTRSHRPLWQSVRATADERARVLPGGELIPQAIDTLTHGATIRRGPRDVWPWLVQMGAGSRAAGTATTGWTTAGSRAPRISCRNCSIRASGRSSLRGPA